MKASKFLFLLKNYPKISFASAFLLELLASPQQFPGRQLAYNQPDTSRQPDRLNDVIPAKAMSYNRAKTCSHSIIVWTHGTNRVVNESQHIFKHKADGLTI